MDEIPMIDDDFDSIDDHDGSCLSAKADDCDDELQGWQFLALSRWAAAWRMSKPGRYSWLAHYETVRDDAIADGWVATPVYND